MPVNTQAGTTTLKLNKTKIYATEGKAYTLKATTNISSSKVKWTTSNKKIVSIKQSGKSVKLTAKKRGKAKITCNANGKKVSCQVIVVLTVKTLKKEIGKQLHKKGLVTIQEGVQQAWDSGAYDEWGLTYEEVMADAPTFGNSYFIGYASPEGNGIEIVSTYTAYGHKKYYLEFLGRESDNGSYKFKCYY